MDLWPRMFRFTAVVLLSAAGLAAPAPAQDDATIEDPSAETPPKPPTTQELVLFQKLLSRLENMQKQRGESLNTAIGRLQAELRRLSNNPPLAAKAYEDAIEVVRYEGQTDGEENFKRWAEARKQMHDDTLFEQAVALQLQYMLLTLELVNAEDPMKQREFLMAGLMDYIKRRQDWEAQVIALENPEHSRDRADIRKRFGNINVRELRNPLKEGLSNSVIVQQFGLEGNIEPVENWEANASNVDALLTKNVMWFLREREDPRLLQVWPQRIEYRERLAKSTGVQAKIDQFNAQVRPNLLWGYAQDMLKLGDRGQAFSSMMRIVEQYPEHPSFDTWSGQLVAMLKSHIELAAPPASNSAPAQTTADNPAPAPSNPGS